MLVLLDHGLASPDYLPRRDWENRSTDGAEYDRYVTYMKNQLKELIENYGDIGVLWFDGEGRAHGTMTMVKTFMTMFAPCSRISL